MAWSRFMLLLFRASSAGSLWRRNQEASDTSKKTMIDDPVILPFRRQESSKGLTGKPISVSCLIRRFMIQVSSCFPGTLPWVWSLGKIIFTQKCEKIKSYIVYQTYLLCNFFRCITPRVTGGVALLGSSTVPHVSVLSIPLTPWQVQLFSSPSPSVLHRFGSCIIKTIVRNPSKEKLHMKNLSACKN